MGTKPNNYTSYGHLDDDPILWWGEPDGSIKVMRASEIQKTPVHKLPKDNKNRYRLNQFDADDIIHDDILGEKKSDMVYKGRIDKGAKVITMITPVIMNPSREEKMARMYAKKLLRKNPTYNIALYWSQSPRGEWLNESVSTTKFSETWAFDVPEKSSTEYGLISIPGSPVFKNPSRKEWMEAISLDPNKSIRCLIYPGSTDLFIWPAEAALHTAIRRKIKQDHAFMGTGDRTFRLSMYPSVADNLRDRTLKRIAQRMPFIRID